MMDGEPWTRVVGFSDMRIFIPLWYSTIRAPLPIACRRNGTLPRGRRCRVSSSEIWVMLLRSTTPLSTQDWLPENDTRNRHVVKKAEIKGVQLHQSYSMMIRATTSLSFQCALKTNRTGLAWRGVIHLRWIETYEASTGSEAANFFTRRYGERTIQA